MNGQRFKQTVALLVCGSFLCTPAWADPCGMVPPIYISQGSPIKRIGKQLTYVFYKDGIETFVIRPGFSGKVEEFGMLIPFPTPPALRKVPDDIFAHIAAAIDPPEVVVDLRWDGIRKDVFAAVASRAARDSLQIRKQQEVRVIREEAVGMYEVAVLDAGSARALKRWMDDHGYRFPKGMDAVCNDYVTAGWCFVAVKTRVAGKKSVDPRPGMREATAKLPPGATFDGYVQAMGFRFRSRELVVPMRLSAFNEGELHNVVYLLTAGARRVNAIPRKYVRRQISGAELYINVTAPLPLRVIGGMYKDIPKWRLQNLAQQRNPTPHNGLAKELFATDLLAVVSGKLSHAFEEREKMLLNIGERLGLRGPEIDRLHAEALAQEREQAVRSALKNLNDLEGMVLTVVDGDFPRDVLARDNLTFADYEMPGARNTPAHYDARQFGPAPQLGGVLYKSAISSTRPAKGPTKKAAPSPAEKSTKQATAKPTEKPTKQAAAQPVGQPGNQTVKQPKVGGCGRGIGSVGFLLVISFAFALAGLGLARRHEASFEIEKTKGKSSLLLLAIGIGIAIALAFCMPMRAAYAAAPSINKLIGQLADAIEANDSARASAVVETLAKRGEAAVPALLDEAFSQSDLARRGWAIVCLTQIGGERVKLRLNDLSRSTRYPMLARTWAAAARVQLAKSSEEIISLADEVRTFQALARPIRKRLLAVMAKGGDVSAGQLIRITTRVPTLQQSLAPAILGLGADALVREMVTASDQQTRRMAASYVATLAGQGKQASVAQAVIAAYKFDPNRGPGGDPGAVPWAGGPLYIPSLSWTREQARSLVGDLIAWHLWCDRRGALRDEQRKIDNGINSWGLARAAGYKMQRGRGGDRTAAWLREWRRVAGDEAVRRIERLVEQKGDATQTDKGFAKGERERENARLIQIAKAECERLRLPIQDRTVTVGLEAYVGIVTFHPPRGRLAGQFIFRIDRKSGDVIDVKIWR